MDQKLVELIYLGFILPVLFSFSLAAEGLYKVYKHEEGYFTFVLGLLFLFGMGLAYYFLFKK